MDSPKWQLTEAVYGNQPAWQVTQVDSRIYEGALFFGAESWERATVYLRWINGDMPVPRCEKTSDSSTT